MIHVLPQLLFRPGMSWLTGAAPLEQVYCKYSRISSGISPSLKMKSLLIAKLSTSTSSSYIEIPWPLWYVLYSISLHVLLLMVITGRKRWTTVQPHPWSLYLPPQENSLHCKILWSPSGRIGIVHCHSMLQHSSYHCLNTNLGSAWTCPLPLVLWHGSHQGWKREQKNCSHVQQERVGWKGRLGINSHRGEH